MINYMVFHGDCSASFFVAATVKLQELEIWGKAQRESARRPKSDWGKLGGGCLLYTSDAADE